MFCGTGKSLVMITYVTDRLDQFPYSVFVFPSLSLITQFRNDYIKDVDVPYLSVSSECESTTDKVIIKKFIELHEQKIICVTYQSLHTLMEVSCDPDIMIFDEAHHAVESYVSDVISGIDCKKVFMTATPPDDDELGPIVYSYTHHDGVIEGKLNDFNIMIDFSTENTNESIYDSIIRAVMKTKNSRVLTFHQRVNTEDDTSVKNFVNQELLLKSFEKIGKEFSGHVYTSVKFLSIDAGTSSTERKKFLKLLDGAKEHEIVILSSCKTIGEGVDTKKANMVVFVDAKNSLTDIIQNIGRVVRKQDCVSTILIPCWVDKTKYEGAEDKDAVIREDLSKQGNFNGILNVISALRQHDPELYDLCLRYPKVFTKEEMKKNFERQGVKDTGNVWTQKQVDKVTEELPELQLEIHTHDIEKPIELIHPEATEKQVLYRDEEGTYHEMKPKSKKAHIVPPRKKFIDVHSSDDIKVEWLITEESLGSAYIECTVTKKEKGDTELSKALKIKQWVIDHGEKPKKGKNASKYEYNLAKKLSFWRTEHNRIIHKKGTSPKPTPEIISIIHEVLPDYFENAEKATEIVEWCEINKRKPIQCDNDPIELRYAYKLCGWKRSLKPGYKGHMLPPSQEVLDVLTKCEHLKDYFNLDHDENMEKALEIIEWCETNKRKPIQCDNDPIELKYAQKLSHWKSSLKPDYKGLGLPPSQEVQDIINNILPGTFQVTKPQCPHVWEVVDQDDEYHYKKCKTCGRRSRSSCVASSSGYPGVPPNPEKKFEINTWVSKQEYIPGKAIVLDARDMKTCNLLPFDPSNIIVPEYDTDTFEENSKDSKFGKCLVNGDFLEVLKTVDPSKISFIYADFTGHFDKWVSPVLEYLSSVKLNSGVILGITWSECGCKNKKYKHLKDLGKFEGANWSEIEDSPKEYEYGHGANMCVDFLKHN